MKKIYTSDNYIIVDMDGEVSAYSKAHSEYDESVDAFIIRKFPDKKVSIVSFSEVGSWFLEDGITPYSEATLREFFRINTSVIQLGGLSKSYKYTVDVYADLAALTGVTEGDIARVYNKQGVWGINQKNEGAYTYLSGVWEYGSRSLQTEVLNNDAEIALKEDLLNKSTNVDTDKSSDIKYPTVKSLYDWATSLFQGKPNYRIISALSNGVILDTDYTVEQLGSNSENVTLAPSLGQTRIINIVNGKLGAGEILEIYPNGIDTIENGSILYVSDNGDNVTLQSNGINNYKII